MDSLIYMDNTAGADAKMVPQILPLYGQSSQS